MSYYEKRIAELEARVAQLAREQRMKAIPVEAKLLERYAVMQADNSRLKAEVEVQNQRINRRDEDVGRLYCENSRLKAEVERLTKLCQATSPDGFIHIRDINAAKEGKPSV